MRLHNAEAVVVEHEMFARTYPRWGDKGMRERERIMMKNHQCGLNVWRAKIFLIVGTKYTADQESLRMNGVGPIYRHLPHL